MMDGLALIASGGVALTEINDRVTDSVEQDQTACMCRLILLVTPHKMNSCSLVTGQGLRFNPFPNRPLSLRVCIGSRAPYLSWQRCGLENSRSLVRFPARPIFFQRTDDSHCDKIHSSLTAVRCLDNGHVVKQPVAWGEYCGEY